MPCMFQLFAQYASTENKKVINFAESLKKMSNMHEDKQVRMIIGT